MASSDSFPRRHGCVFVGNIPYAATEKQLVEICEEIGPVVSFRLVVDNDTGKPKGYGFCEYLDHETALSALRNLQGYPLRGRQLRVDLADHDHKDINGTDGTRKRKIDHVGAGIDSSGSVSSRTDAHQEHRNGNPRKFRSKLRRLEDGSRAVQMSPNTSSALDDHHSAHARPSVDEVKMSWVRSLMPQLSREMAWDVLQQTLRLKPEQLSSLTVEHQLLVLHMQTMFSAPLSMQIG